MRSVNKVFLLGTVGGDPKVTTLTSGKKVAKISLVTNESWKKGEEWVEEATWHNLEMWNKMAEWAEKYVCKGQRLHVEGKIKVQKWEDKDGNKRNTTIISVFTSPIFAGGKRKEGSDSAPEASYHNEYEPAATTPTIFDGTSDAAGEEPPF